MKYVICQAKDGPPIVVLMSHSVMHKFVHKMVRENDLRGTGDRENWAKPVSAGFFRVLGEEVHTYGESESLDLKPREEDAGLIARELARGGR